MKSPLNFSAIRYFLLVHLFTLHIYSHGALVGGRPNAVSGGQNAFAGVINPANAVWIPDRLDLGTFWVHQRSTIDNPHHSPLLPPGKTDLTYRSHHLFTADAAIHKRGKLKICTQDFETSFSVAVYAQPTLVKLRTKKPIPIAGTTPIMLRNRTDVISAVFSIKLNASHSFGFSIDSISLSHRREGFQNSNNPQRSVSPGHVTNRGTDHSHGIGFNLGWRWNITEKLDFGAAWSRKSDCGQFRKYRGFEPHHAKNYTPEIFGAGITYRFNSNFGGRLEVLWSNLSNLPDANNSVLSDGHLNLHKRGSNKSPGPGLQDATFINVGMGYKVNSMLFVGAGYSHRIKQTPKNSSILSHSYRLQAIYDIISLGANVNYLRHSVFMSFSYGLRNRISGFLPKEAGGERLTSEKQNISLSISWGYAY